jgi:large repetitive protein
VSAGGTVAFSNDLHVEAGALAGISGSVEPGPGSGFTGGGTVEWRAGGAISAIGLVTVGGGTTIRVTSPDSTAVALGSMELVVNNGTLELASGVDITTGAGGVLRLGPSGLLTKTATSVVDPTSDIAPTVDNAGTISNTSGGVLEIDDVDNVAGNTLTGGSYVASAGSTLRFGTPITTLDATVILGGPGSAIVEQAGGTNALAGLALVDGTGSLTLNSGSVLTTASDLEVEGTLVVGATSAATTAEDLLVDGGDVTIGALGTVAADAYVQTGAGAITHVNGILDMSVGVDVQAGLLDGTGTIDGNLQSTGGATAPGAPTGTLLVTGTYVLEAAATLRATLTGTAAGAFSRLDVDGAVDLQNGSLNVESDPYDAGPQDADDAFTVITADPGELAGTVMLGGDTLTAPWVFTHTVDTAADVLRLDVGETQAPTGPTFPNPASPSHTPGTPSADTTIQVDLIAGSDGAGSGLAGYAYVFSSNIAADPGAVVNLAAGAASVTSDVLASGSYYLRIRAIDNAGNLGVVQTTPVGGVFVIDVTPPETNLASTPPASTEATTAAFGFNSPDGGATFECRLDGAAFAGCTSPVNLSGLGVGTHTFRVRAIDALGNADPTPAEFTWDVTAAAPPPPAPAPPAPAPAPAPAPPAATPPPATPQAAPTSNDDYIVGTAIAETIRGLAGNDLLHGHGGNDRLSGDGGNDRIYGGPGDDRMSGGAGNDRLDGQAGRDTIDGNDGNDSLVGREGRDVLRGGSGNDSINAATDRVVGDTVDGGPGRDLCMVNPNERARNCEQVRVLRQ